MQKVKPNFFEIDIYSLILLILFDLVSWWQSMIYTDNSKSSERRYLLVETFQGHVCWPYFFREAKKTSLCILLWTNRSPPPTYCWWKKSHTSWYGSLSHYLQGFIHPNSGWSWDFFHQLVCLKMMDSFSHLVGPTDTEAPWRVEKQFSDRGSAVLADTLLFSLALDFCVETWRG